MRLSFMAAAALAGAVAVVATKDDLVKLVILRGC